MTSIPQVEAKGGRLQPIVGQPPNLARDPQRLPVPPAVPAWPAPGRGGRRVATASTDLPPLRLVTLGREAACHYAEEVLDA